MVGNNGGGGMEKKGGENHHCYEIISWNKKIKKKEISVMPNLAVLTKILPWADPHLCKGSISGHGWSSIRAGALTKGIKKPTDSKGQGERQGTNRKQHTRRYWHFPQKQTKDHINLRVSRWRYWGDPRQGI